MCIKVKRWQLAVHCHLRPPIAPAVLGHYGPTYKFSNSENHRGPIMHPITDFSKIRESVADLLMIEQISPKLT